MIKYLKIKNFSIIKDLEFSFDPKLNVIYGESGSGKSLILSALGILCGSNSSINLVREGEEKAILECEIENVGVIQKIIAKNKSSQNIDGENITVSKLKELIDGKIENHSQGEQEEIYTKKYQNDFVDQFCQEEIKEVNLVYRLWKETKDKLEDIVSSIEQKREKRNVYEFYITEIDSLNLIPDEDVQLESKIKEFSSRETIMNELHDIKLRIDEALENVEYAQAKQNILNAKFSLEFKVEDSSVFEYLSDWCNTIDTKITSYYEREGEDLDSLNQRLYDIQKLKKKLSKKSVTDILLYRLEVESELLKIDNFDDLVKELKTQLDMYTQKYKEKDEILSKKRLVEAQRLTEELKSNLSGLGFTYVELLPKLKTKSDISQNGSSEIEFYISFNKGFEPKEMRKVVSGGEASRLALAMKLASHKSDVILILDEVDTGLSGKAVESMAQKLTQIENQIICVTHSKEIIEKGNKKIETYKEDINQRTETRIRDSST